MKSIWPGIKGIQKLRNLHYKEADIEINFTKYFMNEKALFLYLIIKYCDS